MSKYSLHHCDDLPVRKWDTISVPTLAERAQLIRQQNSKSNENYLENALRRQGAIDSVKRIFAYGMTEQGRPLKYSKWFEQQLRLIADNRLRHVITTGASQVSKSLGNYLVMIDEIINGELNTGWFYASRQSMHNQQPEQFQAMIHKWLHNIKLASKVERDSVTRFTINNVTAHFTYVNSDSAEKSGGAAEGKEAASFSANKIYLEERSSYKANVDVTPRLGASRLASKPIRELGTPGGGYGIEKSILDCAHYFFPGVVCEHCSMLSWLDPKGALLKGRKNDRNGRLEYFNVRGEILDYFSHDGTPKTAYIACTNCSKEISKDSLLNNVQLYSKQTQQSVDEFLDNIADNVYFESIAIYLSPLLRYDGDPFLLRRLIEDGLEPENPLIYCQNKLGHPSDLGSSGISLEQYNIVSKLAGYDFKKYGTVRIAGIDQNRGLHHIVIAEVNASDYDKMNIVYIGMIAQTEIIPTMQNWKVDFCLIDNEPDRVDTYAITQKMPRVISMGDQVDTGDVYRKDQVEHGAEKMPCWKFINSYYIERVVKLYDDELMRLVCKVPTKYQAHMCSVKRDGDSGKWLRPPNHEDHYFFANVFLVAAIDIYKNEHRRAVNASSKYRSSK